MRITQRWLDEERGLKWIVWGSMVFMPCVVFVGVALWLGEDNNPLWGGIEYATYGALIGATVGLTGWIRLLISRLLRIKKQ